MKLRFQKHYPSIYKQFQKNYDLYKKLSIHCYDFFKKPLHNCYSFAYWHSHEYYGLRSPGFWILNAPIYYYKYSRHWTE